MWATVAIVALLLVEAGAPRKAGAQEVKLFRLTDVGGYVEFGVNNERQKRKTEGQSWREASNLVFEELLGLEVQGDIYHPMFLRFRGEADFLFSQGEDEIIVGSSQLPGNRQLMSGSYSLSFFEQRPLSFMFYGSNRVAEVERRFSEDWEVRSEVYGARARFRKGPLPLGLSYRHDSRKGGTATQRRFDEVTDEWMISTNYKIGKSSQGLMSYRGQDRELADRQWTSNLVRLDHTTVLDREAPKKFRAYFEYEGLEASELSERRYVANTSLNLQHTKTLWSDHLISFDRSEFGSDFIDRWEVDTGLTHQLYGSLTSSARVEVEGETSSFGTVRRYAGILEESYRKRLGRWGRLEILLAPFFQFEERKPRREFGFVVDEPTSLKPSTPVRLPHKEIDPATILVTNTDRTDLFVYADPWDYTVTVTGDVVELERSFSSRIPEDGDVLVNYSYRQEGSGETLTSRFSLSTRLYLPKNFELYGEYLDLEEKELSGNPRGLREPRRRLAVGVLFSRWWFSGDLYYAEVWKSFAPQRTFSQSLSFLPRGWKGWRSSLAESQSYTQFFNSDEALWRLNVSGRISRSFGRWGTLLIAGEYESQKWSGGQALERSRQDRSGFEVSSEFTVTFRSTIVGLGVDIARLERNRETEYLDRVFLRVRRAF